METACADKAVRTKRNIDISKNNQVRVIADTAPIGNWDKLVSEMETGSYCHLAGWADVLGNVLGHECWFWRAVDEEGSTLGLLPIVRVRSRLFGQYLMSMPFLNGGGALGSHEARLCLEGYARKTAEQHKVDLLELRSRQVPANRELATSSRKITVLLPLPSDPQTLLKGFHQKLRANIGKARKAGMEMRYGADQVEPFYEVFSRNMRDLGTPVLPKVFFSAIAKSLQSHVMFGVLWSGDRPVASQCAFKFGETLEMVWGSSVSEFNKLKVSSHIHWAFIERAINEGCKSFDFGRCTEGSGTHLFKQQWGGYDIPLPWGQWSARGVSSTPSPDKGFYRAAVATWQRLPLAITNRLGPLLARSIP